MTTLTRPTGTQLPRAQTRRKILFPQVDYCLHSMLPLVSVMVMFEFILCKDYHEKGLVVSCKFSEEALGALATLPNGPAAICRSAPLARSWESGLKHPSRNRSHC